MTSWKRTLRRLKGGRAAVILLAAVAITIPATVLAAPPFTRTTIQILDISDWHAQLDANADAAGVPVGGAGALSAYFAQHRAANPNTLTITAGDDFGASPPISGFFEEVPSVLGQRLMGIQINTFGNHNFDRGVEHLQEMIDLAGSDDPSVVGQPFTYVSANLANRDAELEGVEDYKIFEIDGVKVAVIGITNPEAPNLVFPGNFGSIVPTDPVAAAMRAQKDARKDGADVFVIITHMGITERETGEGPLVDLARGVTGFDLIIGDHTDFQFETEINGALVVENKSKSLTYSSIDLVVEKRAGKNQDRVISATNTFHVPFVAGVTPDPAVATMLAPYRAALQPILGVIVGSAGKVIPRSDSCGTGNGRTCESLIGNLVTDGMLAHFPDADFAITNSGGLRANLTCPLVDNPNDFCLGGQDPADIDITRGQTFAVLPFGNFAVTVDMTGAEFKSMLENGVSQMPAINGRFGQVAGLCFTYDIAAAAGSRVTGAVTEVAGACTTTEVDLTSAASYTVAMNDFMAFGGDFYPNFALRQVSDGTTLEQTLADFVGANSPVNPTIHGRIVCTDSNGTGTSPDCPVVTAP
jgi:2',3'-cyclic-nucleotide 2'-phosphodiesterase (5'-nucleotidase family)